QAATFAPEPPPCMVTVAGVSLPRASGSMAWATVSVIRSPMTTMRAIVVITSFANRQQAEPIPAQRQCGDGWTPRAAPHTTPAKSGTPTVPASAYADQRVRADGYQSEAVAHVGSRPLASRDVTDVAKVTYEACQPARNDSLTWR